MGEPADLEGIWVLRRRVADRATGLIGTVHGRLEIRAHAGHLTWVESGRFDWTLRARDGAGQGTRSAPVSRSLRLAPMDGAWWMQFSDGRPFHPWRPGHPVEHPCAADVYRGIVVLDKRRDWMRTLWDVTGPTKEQRLITRLMRLPD